MKPKREPRRGRFRALDDAGDAVTRDIALRMKIDFGMNLSGYALSDLATEGIERFWGETVKRGNGETGTETE